MGAYEQAIGRLIPSVEFHQNRYARELDGALEPGRRWLDLGAGTRPHHGWIGPSAQALAERAAVLVGCDLVPEHLRRNSHLSCAALADGVALPFADESFALVTANMVLEHLPDPGIVLREVARVLSPGGCFVFVTPNVNHPVVRFASVLFAPRLRRALAHAVEGRAAEHIFLTHYRANSVRAVRAAARGTELEVELLEPFSSFPFARVAPLTHLECLWIRLTLTRPLRGLSSNLVGRLRKPGVPAPAPTLRVSLPTLRAAR